MTWKELEEELSKLPDWYKDGPVEVDDIHVKVVGLDEGRCTPVLVVEVSEDANDDD